MDKAKKAQYDIEYARTHLKRVPLNMKLDEYAQLQSAAKAAEEPIQAYIKKAIQLRMANEKTDEG